MKAVTITLQIVGLFALVLLTTIVTLRMQNQDADGPSILFPGGRLVSGELHGDVPCAVEIQRRPGSRLRNHL